MNGQREAPRPGNQGALNKSATTPNDNQSSSVEHAVRALGDLLNLAFFDAVRVDQLARQAVTAFGDIDAPERVALAGDHPKLIEALIRLEVHLERVDSR